MSGPTNRRFVRAAWALLAFQFVAAAGALALAVWAAVKVQALIDQRDLLQARVTQLEAHPAPAPPPPDAAPIADNVVMPSDVPVAVPAAPEPAANAPSQPPRAPPRHEGPGVIVHTPPPPPEIVETPQPPETYVPPPRRPPVRYPPREPPLTYVPPREPPVYYPPRQPPLTYVPPRQIPVRPVRPNATVPPAQQPGAVRPTRPGVTIIRPPVFQPQATPRAPAAQPIDPRRIRRPRPTDTAHEPTPPK
jgi:hypothetical protein